jgi:hypothetical protein
LRNIKTHQDQGYDFFYLESDNWNFHISRPASEISLEICTKLLLTKNVVGNFLSKIRKKTQKLEAGEFNNKIFFKNVKKYFMELYDKGDLDEVKIKNVKLYFDKTLQVESSIMYVICLNGLYTLNKPITIKKTFDGLV